MRELKFLIYCFLFVCFLPTVLLAQSKYKTQYFDGPYIMEQKDSLRIQWIERGRGYDTLLAKTEATVFKRDSLPEVNLQDLDFKIDRQVDFDNVENMVVISDIHGQYDLMIQLLRAHKVIDENNKWSYGNGHLMVVGDNFDRGDKVMDILWFLFFIQKEAALAGGKVHVLLGNHEVMVLNGDLRYLNRKYYYTSGVLKNLYQKLFREGSVLGDWVASHKVLTSINDNLFVHAGMSNNILKMNYSLEKINDIFTNQILRKTDNEIYQDSNLVKLYGNEGPVWYRGYFDTTDMDMDTIDLILNNLNQQKIIIGHTSLDSITGMFDGKVIVVDCSIKLGKTGQVLVWENNEFQVGELDGTKKKFTWKKYVKREKKKVSLFEYIHQLKGIPKIEIETDIKHLIRKKSKEEYQPSQMVLKDENGKVLLSAKNRIRARGNMRKKVCKFPPLKIDFDSTTLASLGFANVDKLKFVLPCNSKGYNQQLLYKEHFLYELYNTIDTNGMHTKLVEVTITTNGKEKNKMVGFLIEDEEAYAERKNAIVVEKGRVAASALDKATFLRARFFNYMIANADWSLSNKHNLELVKLPEYKRIIPIPYDFDYAGFVGQHYAVPHPSLPIKDIHERYFFSYKITDEEYYMMVEFFRSIEDDVYEFCDQATYMKKSTIKENKRYLKSFFQLLKKPDRLKSQIVKKK